MYAPVIVFGYNRKEHLQKTLSALEHNTLAKDTEVFVFLDGAKGDKDKDSVGEVKDFLRDYSEGAIYKSITVVSSEYNRGLAASIIEGAAQIIEQYGKVIVLEDDLVTAADFLEYMNACLDFYAEDSRIWSITGYTLPLKGLKKYPYDTYLSYRASSWAWGTWKDRWETVDWDVKDFNKLCKDKKRQRKLNRGGREMFKMLKAQQEGKVNSWAIRWCYSQSMQDKYTVHPKYNKVANIGTDGSGENNLATNKYFNPIDNSEIHLYNVVPNKEILKEFRDYYRLSFEEVWVLGCAWLKRSLGRNAR